MKPCRNFLPIFSSNTSWCTSNLPINVIFATYPMYLPFHEFAIIQHHVTLSSRCNLSCLLPTPCHLFNALPIMSFANTMSPFQSVVIYHVFCHVLTWTLNSFLISHELITNRHTDHHSLSLLHNTWFKLFKSISLFIAFSLGPTQTHLT